MGFIFTQHRADEIATAPLTAQKLKIYFYPVCVRTSAPVWRSGTTWESVLSSSMWVLGTELGSSGSVAELCHLP